MLVLFLVMCDDGEKGKKRSRGPEDCLNWSDDDDVEFVPYTQSNAEIINSPAKKKVFARKSAPSSGKILPCKSSGNQMSSKGKRIASVSSDGDNHITGMLH